MDRLNSEIVFVCLSLAVTRQHIVLTEYEVNSLNDYFVWTFIFKILCITLSNNVVAYVYARLNYKSLIFSYCINIIILSESKLLSFLFEEGNECNDDVELKL